MGPTGERVLITPPAVGMPGAPAKPHVAKAVFWKAPCADPRLCPEEGQVWTRPQGRRSARTIGHFRCWQQEPPEISFKGHSSGNLRMAPGKPEGGGGGHPSPLRRLSPWLQHLLPAHLGPHHT